MGRALRGKLESCLLACVALTEDLVGVLDISSSQLHSLKRTMFTLVAQSLATRVSAGGVQFPGGLSPESLLSCRVAVYELAQPPLRCVWLQFLHRVVDVDVGVALQISERLDLLIASV